LARPRRKPLTEAGGLPPAPSARLNHKAKATLRIGAGDKTGSGERGSTNTVAIIRPPDRPSIIAAVYYTESSAPMDARHAIHKEIGGLIAETFS
jgi:beta-lactamase class A